MTPRQRQLVLLIGLMGLLAVIFAFMIAQSPEMIDATPDNVSKSLNVSLPYPLNTSVHGLQQMFGDLSSGMSLATGKGS